MMSSLLTESNSSGGLVCFFFVIIQQLMFGSMLALYAFVNVLCRDFSSLLLGAGEKSTKRKNFLIAVRNKPLDF